MMCLVSLSISAQEQKATLHIGDKVPAVKYGTWLKGTPLKKFEKGRLYIFEFWATWCGPCIASMPHLSEFAREHKENVSVIAVDIWEGAHSEEKKSNEVYLPRVTRFVKGMGDKMGFSVMTDTKDEHMGNKWMKAAGQEGIPCSFMVKDSVILWMGHPIQLDSIVKVVTSGSYDVKAAREAAAEKESQVSPDELMFRSLFARYENAVKAQEYDRAINIADSGMALHPNFAGTFGFFKFQTLLEHINEDSAMTFAKEWQKSKPGYIGSAGAMIAKRKGLKKSTYEYGIALLQELSTNPNMPPSTVNSLIADAYANMGDYKLAIEKIEQAIKDGKQSMKDGKFAGFVTEDSIKEYENSLAEYKKNVK